MLFIFLNFYSKRAWKCNQKKNIRQNTIFLEQQIYASQENFTQPLVVMVETVVRKLDYPTTTPPPKYGNCQTFKSFLKPIPYWIPTYLYDARPLYQCQQLYLWRGWCLARIIMWSLFVDVEMTIKKYNIHSIALHVPM